MLLVVFAVAWWWVDPETLDMHAAATLAALAMTFLIQRAQNRDTAALQAKLDELIRATGGARNEMAEIEEKEAEEIQEQRAGHGAA